MLAAVGVLQAATEDLGGITALVISAAAVSGGAVAWRRVAPDLAVVQAVVVVPVAVAALFDVDLATLMATFLSAIITTASLALYGRRPTRSPALLVIAASVVIVVVQLAAWPADLFYLGSQFVLAWVAGYAVRRQLDRVARVSAENARREAELEQAARSALTEERARLAREVHDIVGHGISLMVVHAGAAEQHVTEPAVVRASLVAIQDVGRQAVIDMARLLQVLRSDHDEIGLAPQPGIAELDRLCDAARDAGTPVTLEVSDGLAAVPDTVGLTVYRVVQEGLTNAVRHAPRAPVAVCVCSQADELRLLIRNDPGLQPNLEPRPTAGHGLAGIAERLRLFGGTLRAGPNDRGGFELIATLPLERRLGTR